MLNPARSPWRDVGVVLGIIVFPVLLFVAAVEIADDDPPGAVDADVAEGDAVAVGDVVEGSLPPGGRDTFEVDAEGTVTITLTSDGAGLFMVDEARGARGVAESSASGETVLVVDSSGEGVTIAVEDQTGAGGDYTLSVVEGGDPIPTETTIGPEGGVRVRPLPVPAPPGPRPTVVMPVPPTTFPAG